MTNNMYKKETITTDSLRALIIDDTRLSQHVIQQQLLEGGYTQVRCIDSPKEIRTQIENFVPNVILLDWMMPSVNGLSITRMIRAQDKIKQTHTYVFMITGKDDKESMSLAFQEGVDDFIQKADVATQLIPRMIRAQRMLNQIAAQRHQIELLMHQVAQQKKLMTLDPVSQLPTHRGFTSAFTKAIDSACARNYGLSCMLIHVENYHILKTKLPLPTLHRVVQQFSEKLVKLFRPSDYIARTDVDEFVVLMQHSQQDSISSMDRIERSLNNFALKTKDGYHIINVSTACAKLMTETFTEEWDEVELRLHLRQMAEQNIPLSNRLRLIWPYQAPLDKKQTFDDLIFAD